MAVAIKVRRGDALPASRQGRPKGAADESSAVQIPHGRLVAVVLTEAEIGMAIAVKILDHSRAPAGGKRRTQCAAQKARPIHVPHCCLEGGHISEEEIGRCGGAIKLGRIQQKPIRRQGRAKGSGQKSSIIHKPDSGLARRWVC